MDRKTMIATVRESWAGRTFRCNETGKTVTIPEDVYPKQFFEFGNCFIDVGDGHYGRMGGTSMEEVKDGDER